MYTCFESIYPALKQDLTLNYYMPAYYANLKVSPHLDYVSYNLDFPNHIGCTDLSYANVTKTGTINFNYDSIAVSNHNNNGASNLDVLYFF